MVRKITIPTREVLLRTYLDSSIAECCTQFSVSSSTLHRWLEKYEISKTMRKERGLPQTVHKAIPIPKKQDLIKVYKDRNLRDSARYFNVGEQTFKKWLEHYDIVRDGRMKNESSLNAQRKERWLNFPKLVTAYSTNNTQALESLTINSSESVEWWCAECCHLWYATIRSQTSKPFQCPACKIQIENEARANKFILNAKLLHGEKYNYSNIKSITNTHDLISINCPDHGDFEQRGWDHLAGSGCRDCGNQATQNKAAKKRIAAGDTFAQKHPDLLKEWDYKLNKIDPQTIAPHSSLKAHWICQRGHKYPATISNRTKKNGTGCAKCSHIVSKLEMLVYSYVKANFDDAEWNIKIDKRAIDIFIPSISTCIEVDGYPWHSGVKKLRIDNKKSSHFLKKGYKFLRFRDAKNPQAEGEVFLYNSNSEMRETIYNFISTYFKVDNTAALIAQQEKIWKRLANSYPRPPKHKRLDTKFKEINTFWSERNPTDASYYSVNQKDKVWLFCKKCDGEYERGIPEISKIFMCRPCMYKHGRRNIGTPAKGSSLDDLFPKLAKEWSMKNELMPNQYMPGSHHKAIWTCDVHGDYSREIRQRTEKGYGCKLCTAIKKNIPH